MSMPELEIALQTVFSQSIACRRIKVTCRVVLNIFLFVIVVE